LFLSDNKFDRYNAAVKIQRWWKKYSFKFNHKKPWKYVMTELTHKPGLGIDYFNELEEIKFEYNL